jgi:hypothetical protein
MWSSFLELTLTDTLLSTSNIGVFSIAVLLLTVTYTLLSTSNIGVFSIAVLLITVRNCIHDADSCNGLDKSIMN